MLDWNGGCALELKEAIIAFLIDANGEMMFSAAVATTQPQVSVIQTQLEDVTISLSYGEWVEHPVR